MVRRLSLGFVVAVTAAALAACSTNTQSQPATPTATTPVTATTPATPAVTLDSFTGQWGAADTTDIAMTAPTATASTNSCNQVEFKVVRDVDGKSAAIVFSATCARVRLRGEGRGTLSGDTLYWKAQGVALIADSRQCAFKFLERNTATPVGDGAIKVTYNGTVCDVPVSGTELVRRK
jgi:hypothetical protein